MRLTTRMRVSALLRQVGGEGGSGAVLARGDEIAGALLVILADRGQPVAALERGHDLDDREIWRRVDLPLDDPAALAANLDRRHGRDPDLWVLELDVAGAERFAAEMISPS